MTGTVTRRRIPDEAGASAPATPEITAAVHLPPAFCSWLFRYAGEIAVTEPEHVRAEYTNRLRSAADAQGG